MVQVIVRVVGDDEAAVRAVRALHVQHRVPRLPRPRGIEFFQQIRDLRRLQSVDVRLEQLALHAQHVDEVGRVREMASRGRNPDVDQVGEGADVAVHVDHMGADDQLVRLRVNHAVGVGADDTGGVFGELEVIVDKEQAGAAAGARFVGHVGDEPQPVGPRHQRADAGLRALRQMLRLDRQIGKNAADAHAFGHDFAPLLHVVLWEGPPAPLPRRTTVSVVTESSETLDLRVGAGSPSHVCYSGLLLNDVSDHHDAAEPGPGAVVLFGIEPRLVLLAVGHGTAVGLLGEDLH